MPRGNLRVVAGANNSLVQNAKRRPTGLRFALCPICAA